jgi:hypothetical protein
MALSALAWELYFPILFMPGDMLVTTEHLWVAVSRPTKYGPAPGMAAKAGAINAPIRAAATTYFLIPSLLWDELPETVAREKSRLLGSLQGTPGRG